MANESRLLVRTIHVFMIALVGLAISGVAGVRSAQPAYGAAHPAKTTKPSSPPAKKAPPPASDNRIMVYVFSLSTPKPASAFSSTSSGDDDANSLVKAINNLGPKSVYHACSKGSTDSGCSADTALVLVSGAVSADGTIHLTSASAFPDVGLKALGSASVHSADKLSQMNASDLAQLLGRPQVNSSMQLVLAPVGYQQFVQLVPASAGSNVPDYSGMLIYLLSKRGVTAFRSQMTIGAVGSNPSAQLCTQGEEYFLYSINTVTSPHVLIGTTKLNTFVSGAFLDCNDQTRNRPNRNESGFSGEASKTIPTTKGSALTYAALLAVAIPHLGWTSINSAIAAAGGFADMDPTSQAVQSAVVESSLRNLVDDFCATQPTPASAASSRQQPIENGFGGPPTIGGGTNPGGAGASGGGTTVAWDPTQGAIGPKPYDLRCFAAIEPSPSPSPATSSQTNVINDAVTSLQRSMYPQSSPSPK
jgi:hypothetical protein